MKERMFGPLTESQIDEILREQKIDEGLWDSIKHGLAKVTSIRKKLPFGSEKRAAADKQYQAIVDKADNEFSKQINALSKELKAKGFPNQKSSQEFLGDAHTLAGIYDTVVKSAKDCKIPKEVANEVIADLRKMFEYFIDHELESVYKRLAEAEEAEGPLTGTSDTQAKKELYSTTAPKVLAALGALGLGFGWLVGQPWFIAMFKSPKTLTTLVKVITTLHKKGVTEHLAVLLGRPGANLSGMTVGAMKAGLKSHGLLDASGQPTRHLLDLANNGGNTNFLSWWNTNLAGTMHDSETLAQAIPLSGAGAPGAGGDIFTKAVSTSVTKTIGGGTLSATAATALAAANPILLGLGAGLLASGAAVQILRKHGQKYSRLKSLQAILEEMVPVEDVKCGEVEPEPTEPEPTEPEPTEPGGKGETIHVFRKGPHKFIGRGKSNISLLNRLQQAGLPNWAIKDLTDRIKKELEDKGFVVKEELDLEERRSRRKDQGWGARQGRSKRGDARAAARQRKANRQQPAKPVEPTIEPEGETSTSNTKPEPIKASSTAINDKLSRFVVEFGQDTKVVDDKGKIHRFTRKELHSNPEKFLSTLSRMEKALLLRLPEDPDKEPSKFDFFNMSTDERRKLYLKIKQGKADYTRDFEIQPKAKELEKTKFFISDLRDILKTGHTAHKERPIEPDVIRNAMEQIRDYLSDYLEDAGVALRESIEIDRWSVLASIKPILRG